MNECSVFCSLPKEHNVIDNLEVLQPDLLKLCVILHVENVMEEQAQVSPKKGESPETQETSITEQEETALGGITNHSRTECNCEEIAFIVKCRLCFVSASFSTFRFHITAEDTDRETSQRADDACFWTTWSANEWNCRSAHQCIIFFTDQPESQ